MVDAAVKLIPKNYKFLVKDHPMTPFEFTEDGLQRTTSQFFEINDLAAVVYAATTVGLVSALGLPTIRFNPEAS